MKTLGNIQVGSIPYEVKACRIKELFALYPELVDEPEDIFGYHDAERSTIYLVLPQSETILLDTILHEFLHAASFVAGLGLEEAQVGFLTTILILALPDISRITEKAKST